MPHSEHSEVREQLTGVHSLLTALGSQELNLCPLVYWQAPLPAGPSHHPKSLCMALPNWIKNLTDNLVLAFLGIEPQTDSLDGNPWVSLLMPLGLSCLPGNREGCEDYNFRQRKLCPFPSKDPINVGFCGSLFLETMHRVECHQQTPSKDFTSRPGSNGRIEIS